MGRGIQILAQNSLRPRGLERQYFSNLMPSIDKHNYEQAKCSNYSTEFKVYALEFEN